MSEELRRRFRGKIERRSTTRRRVAPPPDLPARPVTAPVRILSVEIGRFPEILPLHGGFSPARALVRLALGLDPEQLSGEAGLADAWAAIKRLAPGLDAHHCPGHAPDRRFGTLDPLGLAHLILHAALDLASMLNQGAPCHGLTCAPHDPHGHFDIFLDGPDPIAGRSAAVLAAAAVRDTRAAAGRLDTHLRSRDLLTGLVRESRTSVVPEDAALLLGVPVAEALEALDELERLGYLERVAAPFTFSSRTGVLFRKPSFSAEPPLATVRPEAPRVVAAARPAQVGGPPEATGRTFSTRSK